jgi:tripartite ATP-independent transporter DctP family solute receptor
MRKSKKIGMALVSSAAVLSLGLAGCSSNNSQSSNSSSKSTSNASSGPKMTLKLADIQPANYPTVLGDNAFAKEVSDKTNGRIQIKVYPNAQLGDENSAIQQVQAGAIDFGRINSSPLAQYDKQMNVLGLPYLFSSSQQMWDVLNGPVGKQILDGLKDAKMVGLTYYDSGARDFYNTKHPVSKPSDLKGLKIRVQQSNLFVDLVNGFGASATPMNYADVYNALQTGVIDGAENNLPSYYTTNHYKAAKYLTLDEHTRNPEVLLASSAIWSKLTPADQKIVQQAATDSQKVERTAWNKLEQQALDAAKANGNTITKVTDMSAWQKAAQPLYDKYGKDYQDLVNKIRATK